MLPNLRAANGSKNAWLEDSASQKKKKKNKASGNRLKEGLEKHRRIGGLRKPDGL